MVTYDIAGMVRPNCQDLSGLWRDPQLEHLFATYVLATLSGQVYASPIWAAGPDSTFWCGTWLQETAIRLVRETMAFIADYQGPIPGGHRGECGNYQEQDLEARARRRKMLPIPLKDWTVEKLAY